MEKMIAVLVLLILKPDTVGADWSVTYENPDACALKGSSVEFRCSFNYSDDETVRKTQWYKGQLQNGLWKRVKLSDLPSFQNRSEYVGDLQHNCSLKIHDVQDNDTGYYYFGFDTNKYGWKSKESVYLSATDLRATVHPEHVRAGDNVSLQCKTSCQLSSIVWFKDGSPVAKPEFQAQTEDSGNYVCAFEGEESLQSDPVFLDVQYTVGADWSVTYENPDACALKGSSVEFRCSFNYSDDETVRKTQWYKGQLQNGLWKRVKLSDLPSFQNRSEYVGDLQHNCSLKIHDVQDNDTGYYYFGFDTNKYGRKSKESVYLSATDLRATVHPDHVRAGDNVSLQCKTSCQLSSIVWFKDGSPVAKPEFQAQTEDSGNYVCAFEGEESLQSDPVFLDVQYPPMNVSIEVSYPDHLTVNSSVNLTCHSAANPAADNYTWYRDTDPGFSSMVQVGSGHFLSLLSGEVSHSGLYLCQAKNRLGQNNSSKLLLTVDKTEKTDSEYTGDRLILLVSIGVKVVIVLLLTFVIVWVCRRRSRSDEVKEENDCDYEDISTA